MANDVIVIIVAISLVIIFSLICGILNCCWLSNDHRYSLEEKRKQKEKERNHRKQNKEIIKCRHKMGIKKKYIY